jgi:phosphosulfolactate synthase (CoM biosynthesis protein A)
MSFEKNVLNKVENVLGDSNCAEFAYGTLFVSCTEDEARSLFHRLSKDYGFGKVRVSRTVANEFAFDFVA